MTLIIAGLGNIGSQYQYHRHNLGFIICDLLSERFSVRPKKKQFDNYYQIAEIAGIEVALLWPQKLMNLSGAPIKKTLDFYKIPSENLLVIHDEIDLPQGKVKMKIGGSAGGHNGLKDIDNHIGKNYWRMRIGVGHPGHADAVSSYVLSNIPKNEFEMIYIPLFEKIINHFELLLAEAEFCDKNCKIFLKEIG